MASLDISGDVFNETERKQISNIVQNQIQAYNDLEKIKAPSTPSAISAISFPVLKSRSGHDTGNGEDGWQIVLKVHTQIKEEGNVALTILKMLKDENGIQKCVSEL